MTLVYSGSSALEVKTYTLDLTVNGDAGLANRAIIGTADGNRYRVEPGTECA